MSVLLSVSGLRKSYSVPVLRGISLELERGQVLALLGANGAGKSTLCKILCGLVTADHGTVIFDGNQHNPRDVRHAEMLGIRIVMQELNLVGNLSIAENIFFSELPNRGGVIDYVRLNDLARDRLHDVGLANVDPRTRAGTLGVGQQQLVEIARALTRRCELLILDEPTAALTDPQIEVLFQKIAQLQAIGTSVIYVSHRMNEIRQVAGRVCILRDGKTVCEASTSDMTTDDIVQHMAGKISTVESQRNHSIGDVALRVRGISTPDLLREIDLDVHAGEIVGIAGLVGSGRTEFLRAIFGADTSATGHTYLGNSADPVDIGSPRDAVEHGIGMIPEDRKEHGLVLEHSIQENISLAALDRLSNKIGVIDKAADGEAAESIRKQLLIQCAAASQSVRDLSGGNQQKVSIGKWLLRDCNVLLFDEPTRGIDIHAKNAIYDLLRNLAALGKAIVVVSSESRELTMLCDRIAVLSDGVLAAQFVRGEWTAQKILAAAFSEYAGKTAA